MATTVLSVYARFTFVMNDATHVRWTETEFLSWLNAGQVEIVYKKPVANKEVVTLTLAAGAEQELAANGMMLINVIRNTDGAAVTPANLMALSVSNPDWMTVTADDVVKHYAKDPRDDTVFYVYPPNDGNGSLEVLQASYPTAIASTAGNISLDDEYADALLDYCLHRAFGKDDEAASAGKSMAHYNAFLAAVSPPQGANQ